MASAPTLIFSDSQLQESGHCDVWLWWGRVADLDFEASLDEQDGYYSPFSSIDGFQL